MYPEVGCEGEIKYITSGYPIIKFDDNHPYVEDLNGLVTMNPAHIKLILLKPLKDI